MNTGDLKPYKIRYSKADWANMEKTARKTSKVYDELRKSYSKNEIFKTVGIGRWDNLYLFFDNPYKYLTLEKLFIINEMIPHMTAKEILMEIEPTVLKWYEIEDHELHLLKRKITPDEQK